METKGVMTPLSTFSGEEPTVEERLARLEGALTALVWWLVDQSGLSHKDAARLQDILDGAE